MANVEQNAVAIQVIIERLNKIEQDKKTGDQLSTLSSLESGDYLMAVSGTEIMRYTGTVGGGSTVPLTVESFTATHNQTQHTVGKGAISDDDQWSVIVDGVNYFDTKDFTNGLITINFTNGIITFNTPLNAGQSVIIKYN